MLKPNLMVAIQKFSRELPTICICKISGEKLPGAIQRQIKDTIKQVLMKILAFENANEKFQAILHPNRDRDDVMRFLHSYRNVGTYNYLPTFH